MKFDLNDFRVDEKKQVAGVWIDFGGGASSKLASLENPIFIQAFQRKNKSYTEVQRDNLEEKEQENILLPLMARHVILDWKGVYDGDVEIKYSYEKALEVLREIKWVRDKVLAESRKIANFRADRKEKTTKNLPRA